LRDQQVLLFYGGRRPQDICTPPLIARDAVLSARVTCFNAISDRASADGWAGECCLIHELVAKTLGDSMQRHEFYFCGPPPMTDAVARMLIVDYHVPPDQLHYDRFY
jgi:toluene monooxygenase electron transfer component